MILIPALPAHGGARRSSTPIRIALGAILAGCTAPLAAPAVTTAAPGVAFDKHEIVTGAAGHQSVLHGFFLGGDAADLAVASVEPNGDRRLRIYAWRDGAWTEALDTKLRPEVLFVDIAPIGGHDRLLTHESGRLSWFDIESAAERPLVAVTSRFNPPVAGIRRVDVSRDLNGDGRDDLIVPDDEGSQVFIQGSDGVFADPMRLGPPPPFLDAVPHGGTLSYRAMGWTALTNPWNQARVHEMDHDGDGRGDLVFWNQGRFDAHRQNEQGRFEPVAGTFTTGVPFESDGRHSLIFRRERTATVLHSFEDVNDDGISDLVTFSLMGDSVLSQRSAYEVHFGARGSGGGIAFPRAPHTAIRSDGLQVGMQRHDLDGDKRPDVILTSVDLGIFGIIGGLMTRSMSFELEFYIMRDGVYPDAPDIVRKVKADFGGGKDHPHAELGGAFFPTVLIGEVNGDGRPDLLVGRWRKPLNVFPGVPGPDLFARKPVEVAVSMPGDKNDDRELRIYTHGDGPWVPVLEENYTWLVDLDRDGRDDVLLHHPSASEPHRLTVLMATDRKSDRAP